MPLSLSPLVLLPCSLPCFPAAPARYPNFTFLAVRSPLLSRSYPRASSTPALASLRVSHSGVFLCWHPKQSQTSIHFLIFLILCNLISSFSCYYCYGTCTSSSIHADIHYTPPSDDFILFPVLHDHVEEQSTHPVAGVHASYGAQYACQRHFV